MDFVLILLYLLFRHIIKIFHGIVVADYYHHFVIIFIIIIMLKSLIEEYTNNTFDIVLCY